MDAETPIDGPERLRAWRETKNYSLRKVAGALGISAAALHEWEKRTRHCSEPYRVAIERITHGEVPAASWPMSDRERTARENTDGVTSESLKSVPPMVAADDADEPPKSQPRPSNPPDRVTAPVTSTGTEG